MSIVFFASLVAVVVAVLPERPAMMATRRARKGGRARGAGNDVGPYLPETDGTSAARDAVSMFFIA